MKIHPILFSFVLLIVLNSCSQKKACDENLVIEEGILNMQNVYSQPLIGLEWELPTDMKRMDFRRPNNKKGITLKELEALGSTKFFLAYMLNGRQGETLSFGFSYSDTQNAEKDLKKLVTALKKMTGDVVKKSDVAIKQEKINFAGEEVDYMYIQIGDGDMARGQLLKNFGCYNFFVSLEYSTKEQKEKLLKSLSNAKFIK